MKPVEIQAAQRLQAALLRQSKERARDILYLRQASSKNIIV